MVRNKLFDAVQSAATTSSPSAISATAKVALQRASNKAKKSYTQPASTRTDNGAVAKKGTGSAVLNMFSNGGAYRTSTDAEILALIKPALKEEAPLFGACLFYLRDILQGQGERNFFKVSLNHLAQLHPEIIPSLFPLIAEYGRWDDLFCLKGTVVYAAALSYYAATLRKDYNALLINSEASISLAGKWAPSEKAGKANRRLWMDLVADFDSAVQYRRIVTTLRKRIRIVESQMCGNEWGAIDYSKTPSRASLLYRKAFKKHDGPRYDEFIASLKGKPKEEIRKSLKATTLYPYELAGKYVELRGHTKQDATIDMLWEALPDYLKGRHKNSLAVVDTSGSMSGVKVTSDCTALSVAVSLGIYLADNATGIWKDKFITFSERPTFQTLRGKTLYEKCQQMVKAAWDMSTDLNKVFSMILDTATQVNLSEEDMPQTIFIISDMQFNQSTNRHSTNYEQISEDYRRAGYERPNLVFWQVTPGKASPVAYNEYGVALVSGFSSTTFANVMGDEYVAPPTPEEVMRKVLESERYDAVRSVFSALV